LLKVENEVIKVDFFSRIDFSLREMARIFIIDYVISGRMLIEFMSKCSQKTAVYVVPCICHRQAACYSALEQQEQIYQLHP